MFVTFTRLLLVLLATSPLAAHAQLQVLRSFNGTDGSDSEGSLVLLGSTLYGFTATGGVNDVGLLYSMGTDGSNFNPYFSFNATTGDQPHHGYLLYENGLFYRTTYLDAAGGGTLFSITPGGTDFTNLYTLQQATGWQDHTGVIAGANGLLYGYDTLGGTHNLGAAFSFNLTTSTYTDIFNFGGAGNIAGTIHDYPTWDSTGTYLLGIGRTGGLYGNGAVFRFDPFAPDPAATYQTLLSLNSSDPSSPGFAKHGSLLRVGTTLYGLTQVGGANGQGTLFSLDETGGNLTLLHSFGDPLVTDDGVGPYGSLLLFNGVFYGTTFNGGASGNGSIFAMNFDGSDYRVLASLDFSTGINPRDNLTPSADGTELFGTTSAGGAFDPDGSLAYGTVFAIAIPEPGAWAGSAGLLALVVASARRHLHRDTAKVRSFED